MLPFEDRYSRQRRLAEVGSEGQARLCSARLRVAPHPHVDIEMEYLSRAGVSALVVDPNAPLLSCPLTDQFEHAAARGIAEGAWCALSRIKHELAEAPERP
jgi:molybdopterin/thiamine biosynthesis adenylyltransferase